MSTHPYANLPQTRFWKTAVADLDCRQIDLAWKPKFSITRESKIITVGSCFAQHISKSLKENGFSWLDSEPAPAELPAAEHAKHGYGVFSFRTGNIYTAVLLKQWVLWATGKVEQSTEHFLDDGRYFDPFRPSLTVEGFSSVEEMLAARRITLAAILQAILQADVFIFTLGLTEAWLNKDGSVYPMCPGTMQGTFSAEEHVFHNYNEQEVVRDLAEAFDELRGINPNLRFLLTVSPVPLTATASGQHVLTATTYSKSVLRSAAGYLAQTRGDIDYFPSYELITAPVFKGQFFEPNMRSVSPEGVAFVMGQFLGAIGVEKKSVTEEIAVRTETIVSTGIEEIASETNICDDIILETWSKRAVDDSKNPPNILLIGDSHMGMIAKVLEEQGIRYAGGAIMNSPEWHKIEFTLEDAIPYFVPIGYEAKLRWEDACARTLMKFSKSTRRRLWIVTNIGCHVNDIFSPLGIFGYLKARDGIETAIGQQATFNNSDLRNYLVSSRAQHIEIIKRLRKAGFNIVWVSDPPTHPSLQGIYGTTEEMLDEVLREINCHTFKAKQWINSQYGHLPKEFLSTEINPSSGQLDRIHGSPAYYRHLTKEIFNRLSIKPQYRQAI